MRLRRLQRLTARLLAALAVALSPFVSCCPCAMACSAAESCCALAAESSGCCGSADGGSCCTSTDRSVSSESECPCSVQANEPQAPAPESSKRVVDGDSGTLTLTTSSVAINLGQHGASWATAFDREAPGGPPGMQLHAYFSVWQI